MIDRRLAAGFDWTLLVAALALSGLGIATLSGIVAGSSLHHGGLVEKQLLWVGLGTVLLLGAAMTNYSRFFRHAVPLYAGSVILLVAVLVIGTVGFGARRWIDLGLFVFQPSEIAKIAAIALAARFISERESQGPLGQAEFLRLLGIFFVPGLLVLVEPDLGTALQTIMIGFGFTAVVGIERELARKVVIILVAAGVLFGSLHLLGVFSPVDLLEDYQRKRIMVLVDPEHDPYGAGYQIRQSKIAIGSGGLAGRGLGKGPQSRLNFLPAQHTDFIFAVFAEAFGFIGSSVVLGLYLLLVLSGFSVARGTNDRFGSMLAYGLTLTITLQVIINIGMTLGFFPVVGIPLPLMSYGGTSTLMTFFAIGVILSVGVRKIYYR